MNAKIALFLVALGLGIAGVVFFLTGKGDDKVSPIQPISAPVVVDTQPKQAALAPKEAAPLAMATNIAPPTEVAPGIKSYPNKHGDIIFDRSSKTLTQTRKVMIRKGDGTVMEQEVLITGKLAVKPMSAIPRVPQAMKDANADKSANASLVTPGKQPEAEKPKDEAKNDDEKKKKPFVK
jgi:hypothetical protein